jgi:hypothetical protein
MRSRGAQRDHGESDNVRRTWPPRHAGRIAEEVIQHLWTLSGAAAEVTLASE